MVLNNGIQDFQINSSGALLGFLNEYELVAARVGELNEEIVETTSAAQGSFEQMGTSIGNAFGELIVGADFGKEALKQFAKEVISALIATAISNAIANAASATNPANQVSAGLTIPAFIAGAVGAVTSAFANMPTLAQGGLAFGPTTAMVGDNRNARIDPEVIAPLSKLKDMLGGGSTKVYGRISGDDIVISNNRAARDRNRFE